MKRILITGGTGFVGSWMLKIDIQPEPTDIIFANHIGYKNPKLWDQNYDYIIHLAPVPIDDVIKCAQRCNARVLFASSGAVFDKEPDNYGIQKIVAEEKLMKSGLDWRIARMFTFIGHGLPEHLAPMRMLKDAQEHQHITFGYSVRSYLDAEDMANWMWKILLDGEYQSIYNVGSDIPHSVHELADEIKIYYTKYTGDYVWLSGEEFEDRRQYYVPDISRTREDLGVQITIPFEKAVERFVRSYDKNTD